MIKCHNGGDVLKMMMAKGDGDDKTIILNIGKSESIL